MTSNNTDTDPQTPKLSWRLWKQRRYLLTFLTFLAYFNLYSLRTNISVTIVAMTQDRFITLGNGTIINIGPEFKWNNKVQGYILSSFFYGYLLTQILGGVLSKKFGGKFILGCGIGGTAVLTLFCPWLADLGPSFMIAGRLLIGAFGGVIYSSVYAIWSKWIPPLERSRTTSQSFSGCYVGTIFSMFFYGYLAKTAGWRSTFWFSGGSGALWCLAWYYFTAESPEKDSKISALELNYIQQSLSKESQPTTSGPIRWKSILTSWAAWALFTFAFCGGWGYHTFLTLLPKYFKDVHKLDISQVGVLSALPYIARLIMMNILGPVADSIIRKKWLTVTQTRKLFLAIGALSQACFMIGVTFCNGTVLAVFCLVMALAMSAFSGSTFGTNALDIAPHHSAIVFGLTNTIGTLPGIISPTVAGYLISTKNPTIEQWRIIFYIGAGLYLFGGVFYTIFGSGSRQSWDRECDRQDIDLEIVSRKEIFETNTASSK